MPLEDFLSKMDPSKNFSLYSMIDWDERVGLSLDYRPMGRRAVLTIVAVELRGRGSVQLVISPRSVEQLVS